jgi:hypothetical protein
MLTGFEGWVEAEPHEKRGFATETQRHRERRILREARKRKIT